MRVLVAGHLCLDFIPSLSEDPGREPGALYLIGPMEVRLGGAVHTTGAALATLGVQVRLAACVGTDALASVQRDLLQRKGLDTSALIEVDSSTSYSIVVQPPGRDRTFWHHTGCNDHFDGAGVDLEEVEVVHLGYPSLLPGLLREDGMPLRRLLDQAHARSVVTSLDLAVVPSVPQAERAAQASTWRRFLDTIAPATDILTPSIDDLESVVHWGLGGNAAALELASHRLIEAGVAVVMVTGGAAGLHVASTPDGTRLARFPRLAHLAETAGESHFIAPVPPQRIAGTTGAGDTATAAFLATLLDGGSLQEAGARAAYLASRHVAGLPLL